MNRIAFIGLGLIGGSIAKSIRRVHPEDYLYAYDISPVNLEAAVADGTVNEVLSCLDDRLRTCHFIFLCMPVNFMPDYLDQIAPYLSKDCILTDVGISHVFCLFSTQPKIILSQWMKSKSYLRLCQMSVMRAGTLKLMSKISTPS